jgi:hypothetical protein
VALSSSSGAKAAALPGTGRHPRKVFMSPSRRRRRASPEWEGREVITVAALPGRGLYVRHLGHPEGVDGVHRPTVPPPGAQPRPPAYFERHWLADHADDVDVVHVHGVPPRLSAEDVEAAIQVTREAELPLVVTAYHLSDPAGIDETHYQEQLRLLVRAADAVVTITPGAAEELGRRYGVSATVLPHPHAVDFVRMRRARPDGARRAFVVGAHLGSLRMPGDPVAFVQALADAVTQVPDARLAVHLHDHLLDPDSSRYTPDTIGAVQRIVADAGGVARAHRPMTDSQLWDHLFALDVSVVPPLFGSHSIWPEACHDLGTHVALPAGSYAAEQRPCLTYQARGDVPDAAGLRDAIAAARAAETPWRADPTERWKERVGIAENLRNLYERLLGMRR